VSAWRRDVSEWLAIQFPVRWETIQSSLNEPVPNHLKKWWWCIGGIPAYLFVVLLVTGIALIFFYVPDPDRAYDSVERITNEVPFGWYIRGLHKWSATLMIVSVVLHVLRVYFTASYKRPRELTWITGAFLLFITLGFAFTGYSLVYEQLSYWGITVAANMTAVVPVVGPLAADFMRGGETLTADTLTRFFVFHVGVMPVLLSGFMILHIVQIRLHGVTELHFENEAPGKAQHFRFFPDHVLTELIIGVALMIVLSAFAVIFPAHLSERADPLITPAHIKPEWYFFAAFRWLKLTGLGLAMLTMGIGAGLFVAWPFVDKVLSRFTTREVAIPFGVFAFVSVMVLMVWEVIATAGH
jgi:quinol-cytochrome oxidoreductase complex cytochrome b subunit